MIVTRRRLTGAAIENIAPVRSMRVDGPGRLAQLEVLDEQRRHDVHGRRGYRAARTSCVRERAPSRSTSTGPLGRAGAGHAASPDYARRPLRRRSRRSSATSSRFDRPRLGVGRRAARRAPAVPHRHRHGLAGPARRPHDRASTSRPPRSPRPAASPRAAGADVDFVEADVYDAPRRARRAARFDLVYTGIGALIWLPDIDRWAAVVAACSARRAAVHPRGPSVLWALDDTAPDGLLVIEHPYFEHAEPTVWDEPGTYVATDVEFDHTRQPRVEPRARRDRHRAARPRHGADDVRRARQRAVGRPARPDGADRRRRVAPRRPP